MQQNPFRHELNCTFYTGHTMYGSGTKFPSPVQEVVTSNLGDFSISRLLFVELVTVLAGHSQDIKTMNIFLYLLIPCTGLYIYCTLYQIQLCSMQSQEPNLMRLTESYMYGSIRTLFWASRYHSQYYNKLIGQLLIRASILYSILRLMTSTTKSRQTD